MVEYPPCALIRNQQYPYMKRHKRLSFPDLRNYLSNVVTFEVKSGGNIMTKDSIYVLSVPLNNCNYGDLKSKLKKVAIPIEYCHENDSASLILCYAINQLQTKGNSITSKEKFRR